MVWGGPAMVRAARWRACGACPGLGRARARVQRVGGIVACPGVVGSVSGAGWSGQGGRGTGCTPGARRLAGIQSSRGFGTGRGRGSCGLRGGLAWVQGERRTLVEARGAWESERGRGREREWVAAWP